MPNPLVGMSLVLIVFFILLSTLRTWQRKYQPDAEWVRKLLHLGMGLFTLSLPWLFADAWPVWVMCGVMLALLVALRVSVRLQQQFGAVLGSVARRSQGELYFTLGVTALFLLAQHDRVVYSSAILVLTFADAAAALVGKRFGTHPYPCLGGNKSLEGSLAFGAVAMICLALPFVVVAGVAVRHAVLLALTIAPLLMVIEAVAARGLDNLLLPLATYWLLTNLSWHSTEELSQLLLLMVLATAVLAVKRTVYLKKQRKGVFV